MSHHLNRIARAIALTGAIAAVLGSVGCVGPVMATKEISDANGALERARIADAHEKAPYEYYTAERYLYKAKEEWGYSDFQASERYAEEAVRSAQRALTKAKEDPYTGSPVPREKLDRAMLGVSEGGRACGAAPEGRPERAAAGRSESTSRSSRTCRRPSSTIRRIDPVSP